VGSGTAKGAERRAHSRLPVQLPVRVTLLTTPLIDREVAKARAAISREPVVTQAMALDVSERGLLLEIAGASIQTVLDASDPLVGVEFAFMHPDLRYLGPRAGHVQWRRAGPDRNTWALGARLDVPLTPDDISRIVRCSTNRPKSRPGVAVLFGATALLGVLGWYRSHATDVAERDGTMRRLSMTEDDLIQVKQELERCRASQDTLRSAPPLHSPPSTSPGEKSKADPSVSDAAQTPAATDWLDGGASADAGNGAARRDTTR
jgi:hypothetical protein